MPVAIFGGVNRIAKLVAILLVAVVALACVFVVGMRTKAPPVLRTVRRVNRAFFNPRQMASAGTPGAYASVIRHRGRRSGNEYETPVVVTPTDGGFVIVLPYGTTSDWLKNVLASGSATIVTEGEAHEVDRPEVLPIEELATAFSERDQRSHRLFGVNQGLRVRKAPVAS